MTRRVLVIGSGGREHALAWKLAQSASISGVFCTPGNPGTAEVATNLPLAAKSIPGILAIIAQHQIDFVMIGPEEPLALGLADALRASNILVCGHSAAAARIESSKAFAKAIMAHAGIPTARSITATTRDAAIDALALLGLPVVIKADGLAAGKGVVIAGKRQQAIETIDAFMIERQFGNAGSTIVLEEFLTGLEVSAFALVQGETVVPLMASCDHKPVFDGNNGPNTGGMGAYAPPPQVSAGLLDDVLTTIMQPAAHAMAIHGAPLQGVLYAGLMLTADGPKVIEFNARFGDPETQVILPLLESDLGEALYAVAAGTLAELPPLAWKVESAVCVVLASDGYPGSYPAGLPIDGIADAPEGVVVFQAGTTLDDGRLVTSGGRVLDVVGFGSDIATARANAYAGVEKITFTGMHYRNDIGSFGVDKGPG